MKRTLKNTQHDFLQKIIYFYFILGNKNKPYLIDKPNSTSYILN
jgi:hypothetical protein